MSRPIFSTRRVLFIVLIGAGISGSLLAHSYYAAKQEQSGLAKTTTKLKAAETRLAATRRNIRAAKNKLRHLPVENKRNLVSLRASNRGLKKLSSRLTKAKHSSNALQQRLLTEEGHCKLKFVNTPSNQDRFNYGQSNSRPPKYIYTAITTVGMLCSDAKEMVDEMVVEWDRAGDTYDWDEKYWVAESEGFECSYMDQLRTDHFCRNGQREFAWNSHLTEVSASSYLALLEKEEPCPNPQMTIAGGAPGISCDGTTGLEFIR